LIQLGASEPQLLRIIAKYALGGTLDATLEILNFAACPLARLPGLGQITFLQHFAGDVQGLPATLSIRCFLQAIVKIPCHATTGEKLITHLLHGTGVILANFAYAVI